MRSDKTSADEAKIWVSAILTVVTAITAYLAFIYYQDVFSNTLDTATATVLAIALAAVVEIGKIKLALRALHSILFGWISESATTWGYWGFICLLAGGSFYWSVRVSTKGLAMYSTNHAEATISKDSLAPLLAAATASVDQQIASETSSRTAAQGNKWKGTIVYVSSKQAKKNTENITKLQDQRAKIVDQTVADYKDGLSKRSGKISAFAYFIREFGGYQEIVAALCLLAIAFFNLRLVEISIETNALPDEELATTEQPDNRRARNPAAPAETPRPRNGAEVNNVARPIGYNVRPDGNVARVPQNRPAPPVPHCTTAVPQSQPVVSDIGHDAIVRNAQIKLGREMANLEPKAGAMNGTVASISRRVYTALGEVEEGMCSPDFKPSSVLVTDFFFYVQDVVFPTLRKHGVSKTYDNWFLETLEKFVPATAFV